MAWYRNGTVTMTNGGTAVVGTSTDFVSNVTIGEIFVGPDRGSYEVAAIVSATQLTLAEPYQGPGGGGQSYKIAPTSSFARDLALAFSGFKNTFGGILDTIGQGMFGDGTVAAPGIRFFNDQDTGIRRGGPNAVTLVAGGVDRLSVDGASVNAYRPIAQDGPADGSACSLQFRLGGVPAAIIGSDASIFGGIAGDFGAYVYGANSFYIATNAQRRLAVDAIGNVGIGTSSPQFFTNYRTLHIEGVGGSILVNKAGDCSSQLAVATGYGCTVGTTTGHFFGIITSGEERGRFDPTGNLLVGVTASAGWGGAHRICKLSAEGTGVLSIDNGVNHAALFYAVNSGGFSTARAAQWLGKDSSTGRSINAGGTINATGADYAEYMLKSNGCGHIAKGDVCGVDADGRLTKSWAAAKSFVVKSTDPAYVGGDSWADHLPPKPSDPGDAPVAPVAPIAPASLPPEPVLTPREDGEDDESFTARAAVFFAAGAAQDALVSEHAAYNDAVAAFPGLLAAHGEAHAGWEAAKAAYEVDLPAWEADLEKARQSVDRIAFAGQVPVNIAGDFAVGDYLIASANGGGIEAVAVAEADITFDQYRRRLGKVWAIREGRPWIDVQHG